MTLACSDHCHTCSVVAGLVVLAFLVWCGQDYARYRFGKWRRR